MAANDAHKAKLVELGAPENVAEQSLRAMPPNSTGEHVEALVNMAPDKKKVSWPALPGLLQAIANGNLVNVIAALQAFFGSSQAQEAKALPPKGQEPPPKK